MLPIAAVHRARLAAALALADLIILLAALYAALPFPGDHAWAVLLAGFGTAGGLLGVGAALSLYDVRSAGHLRRSAFATLGIGLLGGVVALLGVYGIAGAAAAASSAPIGLAGVLGCSGLRVAIAALLERHRDALGERVVLVGTPAAVAPLLAGSRRSWVAPRVAGVVAIGEATAAPIATLTAIDPQRDGPDALVEDFWRLGEALRGKARRLDRVLIVAAGLDEATLTATLDRLEHLPFEIALLPPGAALAEAADPLDRAACPVLRRAAITPWGMACKRALDVAAAALLLAVLAPVLLILAVLVRRSSPGPALFRQTRWGWNNEPFTVYKFRTMWADAAASDGSVQATRGDARITPIGRFLRSTSLDELPQLFNVLNGTMSLVGPRPHPVELNLRYLGVIARYAGRHRVLPGITGLAQVNGLRGETRNASSMQRRVDFDLEYIRTRSLAADVWILLRTVSSVARGINAY
jgi:exopolysaccharide biosynthesis polyprenyl glycosylphosphotransferase